MVPITKRAKQPDGSVIVSGPVTDGALDLDDQIVDPVSAAKSLKSWFAEWGNIRQQHSAEFLPAGKALNLDLSGEVPELTALVVEPGAVLLTETGVYKGFSIGIADGRLDTSPDARKAARNGILYPSLINEVSLVDYPANPRCRFTIAKRKGGALVNVQKGEILDEELRKIMTITDKVGAALKRDMSADERKEARWHAGKNRSFPIDKPEDIAAAASSIGRAGPDNFSTDRLKKNIIRIAHEGGAAFVAKLPESWKADMGKKKKAKDGGEIPEVDQKVTEALDAAAAAIKEAEKAQAVDNASHESGDDADDPDKDTMSDDGGSDDDGAKADKQKVKKAKTKKSKGKGKDKKKKGKVPAFLKKDDDGDDDSKDGSDDDGDKADAKKVKTYVEIHDILCPGCKAKKSDARRLPKLIAKAGLEEAVAKAASSGRGELNAAARTLFAAEAVRTVAPETFVEMREKARKAFLEAYPDMPGKGPDLMNPESFRRGFLPGATDSVAHSMNHPDNFPTAHPLSPEQFARGPLTANETRPSLVGGHSVAKFYEKGMGAAALTDLHDAIAANYPTVCPAGSGLADEVTDRLGTAPEMYSPASPMHPVDTKGQPLAAVGVGGANKAAKKNKALKRKLKRLERTLQDELARPNKALSARRSAQFTPVGHGKVADADPSKKEALARAKKVSKRIHDRNATVAAQAVKELQTLVTPEQFARFMTADGD